MQFPIYTMENQPGTPKAGGLEDDFPFQMDNFKVPYQFSRVYVLNYLFSRSPPHFFWKMFSPCQFSRVWFKSFTIRRPGNSGKSQVVLVTGQVCSEERALEFQSCLLGGMIYDIVCG